MSEKLTIKIAHLGMIQGVISRMASDAQNFRAIALTLVGAIIAIGELAGKTQGQISLAAMIPTIGFWWMTARHLHIERAYRHLYDQVRQDAAVEPFSMDWRPYRWKVGTVARLMASYSVMPLFVSVLGVLGFIAVLRWD